MSAWSFTVVVKSPEPVYLKPTLVLPDAAVEPESVSSSSSATWPDTRPPASGHGLSETTKFEVPTTRPTTAPLEGSVLLVSASTARAPVKRPPPEDVVSVTRMVVSTPPELSVRSWLSGWGEVSTRGS